MKSWTNSLVRSSLVALLAVGFASTCVAHVFTGPDGRPLRWPDDHVAWRLSVGTDSSLGNITAGSDPAGAIEASFDAWASQSGLTATRGADSVATNSVNGDGVNLVSFADTAGNRSRFQSTSTLAVTIYRFVGGTLTDVDMLFNPDLTWSTVGQVGQGRQYSIQAIGTHEAGHFVGVAHSAIGTASLYPFGSEIGDVNGSTESPASLSRDDLAAINGLYPDPAFLLPRGGIRGRITLNGVPIYGGHVTATSVSTGIPTSAFLTLDRIGAPGEFDITGLPAGDYLLHLEPTDGPTSAGNWGLNDFDTGYRTTFFGGNEAPGLVSVTASQVTVLGDLAAEAAGPVLNPRSIAPLDANPLELSGIPVRMEPGETRTLVVTGTGFVGILPTVSCSDPRIVLGPPSSPALGLVAVAVTVPSDAEEGGRNLIFEHEGEVAVFTGAFDIDCLGDPDCRDSCPDDDDKTSPGECGCGVPETGDRDSDGVHDCNDECPDDPLKALPGDCGCGMSDVDSDSDGTANCLDGCPFDADKISPGDCGCFIAETDRDDDGTPDCIDDCPDDPDKQAPGDCGCGEDETDSDSDGTADCIDGCPADPDKSAPGACGCGLDEALPGEPCECVQGDLHGADGAVDLRDWLIGLRKLDGAAGGVTALDDRCGDLAPGVPRCHEPLASAWCPSGNGAFDAADLDPLRLQAADLQIINCGPCPPPDEPLVNRRLPGDVVGPAGVGADGIVNVTDVVKMLNWAVGIDRVELDLDGGEPRLMADVAPSHVEGPLEVVEGDGAVNVTDVILALRAAVGAIELAWGERSLTVSFSDELDLAAHQTSISDWPPWATPSGFSGPGCTPGVNAALDHRGPRWVLSCANELPLRSGPADLATWRYRAPEDIGAGQLTVEARGVTPELALEQLNASLAE